WRRKPQRVPAKRLPVRRKGHAPGMKPEYGAIPQNRGVLQGAARFGLVRARPLNRGRKVMKTCLVVDDSSVIRKVARRILEGLEFEISEAEDGEEALTACQRRLPDAVLLDWNMPKMDGYEFLRALR